MSLCKQAIQSDGVIYIYGEVITTGSAKSIFSYRYNKEKIRKKFFLLMRTLGFTLLTTFIYSYSSC